MPENAAASDEAINMADIVAQEESTPARPSNDKPTFSQQEIADETFIYNADDEEDDDFDKGEINNLHRPAQNSDVLTRTIHVSDDPSMPAITFRSMFLGTGLSIFGGVLSAIYYFKPQEISLSPVFLAVLAYLLGEAMSLFIPRRGRIGRLLNPHAFNIKEHLAITIMASASAVSALGIQVISVERLYYNNELSAAVSIFLLLSSQYLGYGIAGLMRRTMLYPKAMLWPANIPINSMLENLHSRSEDHSNRKPLRIFLYVFAAIFVWEIFPQWICTILTGVSIFCLADQNSTVFTHIFGGAAGNEGLGLLSLCFDWQQITAPTSPLYFPISSLISQGIGITGCIILFAGVYYSNVWNALDYPFLSQLVFSNSSTAGNPVQWNQTLAIGADSKIDMGAVAQLGLPAFSATNALNMMLTNMSMAAAIVHLFLWYPREAWEAFAFLDPRNLLKLRHINRLPAAIRRAFANRGKPDEMRDNYDPHYRLMLEYAPCPDWWYGIVLLLSAVIALVLIYKTDTTLPWWGFVIAAMLGYVLIAVLGAMQAITGVPFTSQSRVQMIGGYIHPGYPVANMYFSLYAYNALVQGKLLAQDLKLAQYGHLAPRVTFFVQMWDTLLGALFNYIIANDVIKNQATILLSVEGTNIWSGANLQQFNSQAVARGGLSRQLFSVGAQYEWVTLVMIPGLFVPLPLWLAHRRWPNLGLDNINTSVTLFYLCYLNVGVNSSIFMFFIIGFISQGYIRRRYPNVFVKYNYLISAALDGGSSVMVFILSFAVLGAAGAAVQFPKYWGNNVDGNPDRCASAN
ncbi:hypothetical protein M409DRAFT_68590 [Zasmidium cellare ATCC 36951]|uniref:OPT superfamily oligopeptide transporter n=1 Tax=Zasmidium cellare ATCC 36951 TaxID=1080233 RepID=A0A6A6C8F3_ZASCE|nr:uncharacterized protein M409DRAFT_68590 [Zasmidium cellare ATCC 36951]KAF2163315.1 hypothetical protein M409DRAFT_68590 [Zasmidium cellare ATCC 36951]